MARREAKTQEKKARTKAPATPPPPAKPAPKGSRRMARAVKLEARRDEKFERNGVTIVEPKYKDDRWKVLAYRALIGEPRTRRNALKRAHQFCRDRGR